MSKPSAEVPAGRLSVQFQALTFSVVDVLKDLDPLVDENISTSKHVSSKWAELSLAYQFIASLVSVVPEEIEKKTILYTSLNHVYIRMLHSTGLQEFLLRVNPI